MTYAVTLSSHFCPIELFRRVSNQTHRLTLSDYHKRYITKVNILHHENPPLRFLTHFFLFNTLQCAAG
ncbi:hypothetical protein DLA64_05535 [Salmonella enterica]|nr:hypothetical protein [Salmonella enterica]EBI9230693.1 hypothetical protein [Salmonella enterica]